MGRYISSEIRYGCPVVPGQVPWANHDEMTDWWLEYTGFDVEGIIGWGPRSDHLEQHPCPIDIAHYGYEFQGVFMAVAGMPGISSHDGDPTLINISQLNLPDDADNEKFMALIEPVLQLIAKFDLEVPTMGWHMLSHYG